MVKAVAGSPLRACLPVFQSSPFEPSSAPFCRAFWLVCTIKAYSGLGADIVMESITLIDPSLAARAGAREPGG
jgi:hypothetical protein